MRRNIIPNIISMINKQSDNELAPCFDKKSCNEFIHTNVNNYNLRLLNIYPKRFYIHRDHSFKTQKKCNRCI